jgi:proteasome accessory factor C
VSAVTQRLPRLLAMVPYLQAHPGVRVSAAAAELGVSPEQLRKDLSLLWMCGLPGYGPGELIDLTFEGDTISVIFDAGMSRPLRLSRAEAGALAVALRALGEVGGLVERDVVERALAKVESAAGGSGARSPVAVGMDHDSADDARAAVTATLAAALADRHPVALRYYTATRDDVTERVVEPQRLLVVDGRTYLEAWCRRAEDVRLFRVDRVEALTVLAEVLTAAAAAAAPHRLQDPFDLGPDLPLAELELAAHHGWVAEYYPVESAHRSADGGLRVSLRYTDTEWLVRLVLGLGAGARVLAPAELGAELRSRAQQAVLAYAQHPPFTSDP